MKQPALNRLKHPLTGNKESACELSRNVINCRNFIAINNKFCFTKQAFKKFTKKRFYKIRFLNNHFT